MTVCNNCGTDNIPGNRFCQRCGSELGMQPVGSRNEYLLMDNRPQQGGFNPGMGQAPHFGNAPYPPQQYPSQPYGQRPPMSQQHAPAPREDNSVTVRFSQREKALLQAYAQFNKIPMEEFVKKAAMEKLTEEFDKKTVDSAYKAFMDNPETYTLEEVMENYDL